MGGRSGHAALREPARWRELHWPLRSATPGIDTGAVALLVAAGPLIAGTRQVHTLSVGANGTTAAAEAPLGLRTLMVAPAAVIVEQVAEDSPQRILRGVGIGLDRTWHR